MAWNGSGVFSRTNGTHSGSTSWEQDRVAGDYIIATRHDTHDEDLAAGLNACLTKNNETKATAHFAPNASATYDLGTASLKWRYLYLNGMTFSSVGLGIGAGVTTAALLHVYGNDTALCALRMQNPTASTGKTWQVSSGNDGLFRLTVPTVIDALTMTSAGVATFAGTVVVTGTANSIPMPAFSTTPVTMTAGYTNTTIEVSKDSHGVVWIKGYGNKDVAGLGALTYFTLAAGYRPDQAAYKIIRNSIDTAVACAINTDGTVVVTHATNNNGNTHFDLSFPTT